MSDGLYFSPIKNKKGGLSVNLFKLAGGRWFWLRARGIGSWVPWSFPNGVPADLTPLT